MMIKNSEHIKRLMMEIASKINVIEDMLHKDDNDLQKKLYDLKFSAATFFSALVEVE